MRYLTFFVTSVVFLFSAESISQEVSASLLNKMEGFSHPESVVLDEKNQVLYVSNIGGKTEGDGFISKVSKNGEILELKWITQLNDPKGLLVMDDYLYVTDNKYLVKMDIENTEITSRMLIEEAVFLNDITADDKGNIYISDTGKSSIYKLNTAEEISEWLNTRELEFPNGLLAVGDEIWIAAWGEEDGGNVLKVDIGTKQIEKISKKPIGNLDGIQLIGNKSFYISDWATGKIYKMDSKGNQTEILTAEKSAGDILFLKEENIVVLPMNHQNEVWWYQLE